LITPQLGDKSKWTETHKKSLEKPYDDNPQNLKMFLERLADRVTVLGCKIITVIKPKDLITQYGMLPIEDCRDEANFYLNLYTTGKLVVNRKAQLSAQMLTRIKASISDECEFKVVTRRDNLAIKVKKKNHTVKIQVVHCI